MLLDALTRLTRHWDFRGKGRLYGRFTPRRGTRRIRATPKRDMQVDLANGLERQMYIGCFHLHVQRVMRQILRPGGTFLDIGANCGFFTLLASELVGDDGRVFAVEPFPGSRRRLIENLSLNAPEADSETAIGNVRVMPFALGDAEGALTLYAPADESNRDFNVTAVPQTEGIRIDVPLRRLDAAAREWGLAQVQLAKIDVEGSEAAVLRGGAETFASGAVHHLICEFNVHYLQRLGSSTSELLAQIKDLGFVPATISGGAVIPSVPPPAPPERGDEDLLFVHRTRLGAGTAITA